MTRGCDAHKGKLINPSRTTLGVPPALVVPLIQVSPNRVIYGASAVKRRLTLAGRCQGEGQARGAVKRWEAGAISRLQFQCFKCGDTTLQHLPYWPVVATGILVGMVVGGLIYWLGLYLGSL